MEISSREAEKFVPQAAVTRTEARVEACIPAAEAMKAVNVGHDPVVDSISATSLTTTTMNYSVPLS